MGKSKRRTSGDGGFYQRDNGLWVGVVEIPTEDGSRRRRYVQSMDRNEAIEKLKKLRGDVDSGRIPITSRATVGDWLEKWIEEIHGPKLRPTSYRSYKGTIDQHIIPHIGTKRLDKLLPEHVRAMHRAIPSSRTAQLAHVVLQRALDDAVKEGMLARNVAKVAEKPRHVTEERKPLTADQAKKLLRVSSMLHDPMVSRWAAALYLGARQGELLGLEWDRVDLENGSVDLAWQLQKLDQEHGCGEPDELDRYPCGRARPGWCPQRRWNLARGFEHRIVHRSLVLTRPKTKAGTRKVPIPPPLWTILEQHPRGDTNPHGLVWHHDDGRPIAPRADHSNWKAALAAADLPESPLHAARNTTATLLMEAGVDPKIIQTILGHASIVTTRGYLYADDALTRRAVGTLKLTELE